MISNRLEDILKDVASNEEASDELYKRLLESDSKSVLRKSFEPHSMLGKVVEYLTTHNSEEAVAKIANTHKMLGITTDDLHMYVCLLYDIIIVYSSLMLNRTIIREYYELIDAKIKHIEKYY